ncbi:hypothetical protein O181_026473 [Austropuccinia psidii MF-1]|uniref:Tc1-like transposase DDE domain-containing protein n=1 Tax=Austropuccinia psidii MF-1 TaxID=1389203 RepID=A0A9Q3H014_9BASI|nr:hypothetical protein [Austropuccinia psidii MF-1]
MEDNVPIHMAAFSNQWHKQNGIVKMKWLAHSPDLNPIKNIWKSMKSSISKLYQLQNLEELKHAIQSTWSNIHPGLLNAKEDADCHQSMWWSNLILRPPRHNQKNHGLITSVRKACVQFNKVFKYTWLKSNLTLTPGRNHLRMTTIPKHQSTNRWRNVYFTPNLLSGLP